MFKIVSILLLCGSCAFASILGTVGIIVGGSLFVGLGTTAAVVGGIGSSAYYLAKETACQTMCTNAIAKKTAPWIQELLKNNPGKSFQEIMQAISIAIKLGKNPDDFDIESVFELMVDLKNKALTKKNVNDFIYSLNCLKNCKATTNMRYTCKIMEYMDTDSAQLYGLFLNGTGTTLGLQNYNHSKNSIDETHYKSKFKLLVRDNKDNSVCIKNKDKETTEDDLNEKYDNFRSACTDNQYDDNICIF